MVGPRLHLTYLHGCPFIDVRLFGPKIFPSVRFAVKSGDDVDSTRLMDPQGRSSVSNAPTFAANCQLQDLRIRSLFVACWLEFEGDFPLFGEGGEGCQKAVPLQQVFTWKRE